MPCANASAMSGQFQLRTAGGAYLIARRHTSRARGPPRRIDDDLAALDPFAAEFLEQRRIDVHVLPRAGEAAQRHALHAVVRIVHAAAFLTNSSSVSAGFRPFAS